MSIDYDRLREMVQAAENHTAYDLVEVYAAENELENLAPELARELLRLRDGVGELVERKRAAVKRLDITRPIAAAILDVTCDDLEDLFKGDTE